MNLTKTTSGYDLVLLKVTLIETVHLSLKFRSIPSVTKDKSAQLHFIKFHVAGSLRFNTVMSQSLNVSI